MPVPVPDLQDCRGPSLHFPRLRSDLCILSFAPNSRGSEPPDHDGSVIGCRIHHSEGEIAVPIFSMSADA